MEHDLTSHLTFRVHPDVAQRVEQLAAHAGLTRGAWMRAAIGLADTTVTLAHLRNLEANGGLTERQQTVQRDARDNLDALARAMRPKPMPDFNLN